MLRRLTVTHKPAIVLGADDELLGDLHRMEDHALAGAGDVR